MACQMEQIQHDDGEGMSSGKSYEDLRMDEYDPFHSMQVDVPLLSEAKQTNWFFQELDFPKETVDLIMFPQLMIHLKLKVQRSAMFHGNGLSLALAMNVNVEMQIHVLSLYS